jgi:hypothetical protein
MLVRHIMVDGNTDAGENKVLISLAVETIDDQLIRHMLSPSGALSEGDVDDAAIEEIRRDSLAHVTSLLNLIARGERIDEMAGALIRHLGLCSWCLGTVAQVLEFRGASVDHPAQQVIADAREWTKLQRAAQLTAAKEASEAHDQGVAYVYGRDGETYRRLPDGTEVPVTFEAGARERE